MKKVLMGLAVLAIITTPLHVALAASDVGFKSLGVDLGYVDPEDVGGTIGFGAFADLGTLSPRVALSTHLDYWSKTEDLGLGSEASVHDVSLTGRVRYMFPVSSPKFRPYAGGGLGFHSLNAEVTIPDQDLGGGVIVPGMTVSDSQMKIGLDMGGGFVTPVGAKTDLYGDLWYSIVEDFGHVSMKMGIAFRL